MTPAISASPAPRVSTTATGSRRLLRSGYRRRRGTPSTPSVTTASARPLRRRGRSARRRRGHPRPEKNATSSGGASRVNSSGRCGAEVVRAARRGRCSCRARPGRRRAGAVHPVGRRRARPTSPGPRGSAGRAEPLLDEDAVAAVGQLDQRHRRRLAGHRLDQRDVHARRAQPPHRLGPRRRRRPRRVAVARPAWARSTATFSALPPDRVVPHRRRRSGRCSCPRRRRRSRPGRTALGQHAAGPCRRGRRDRRSRASAPSRR